MKNSMMFCAAVGLFMFCGCGGGSGGGQSKPVPDLLKPNIQIDALGMQGALDESAIVLVNSLADADAADDAVFSVLVSLGAHGLPADPAEGSSANAVLDMTATDPAGNVGGQELEVLIHH